MEFGISPQFADKLAGKDGGAPPAQDPPAQDPPAPPAQDPPAQDPPAQDPPAPPAQDPPSNDPPAQDPPTPPAQDPPAQDPPSNDLSINDEAALNYLKAKGFKGESLDDVLKANDPVEKIINPYEKNTFSEKDQQFFKYNEETGRSYDDFLKLNADVKAIPAIDLARERIRNESGSDLSDADVDRVLERRLQIDLTDLNEIDVVDRTELETFAKPLRDQKEADKEKYNKPIEKPAPVPGEEMIQLEGGQTMKKADYDKLVDDRNRYLDSIKTSVDSVAGVEVKVTIDDNGTPREVSYGYDYSQDDKAGMVMDGSDVEKTIEKRCRTNEGFNHAKLIEGLWWGDEANREKALKSIAEKAYAQAATDFMKKEHNVNFERNRMPGSGEQKLSETNALDRPGFGVKYDFPTKP